MKRKLFFILFLIGMFTVNTNISFATCPISNQGNCTNTKSTLFKQDIKRLEYERATVYNALNLTDEQVIQQEKILKETGPIYDSTYGKLIDEIFRLKALVDANACSDDIKAQKKVVKNLKNDLANIVYKENKQFKKTLTREQRAKYSMIKKLERKDYRESSHQKDYYKSNPQMRKFGNPSEYRRPIGSCENK